MPYTSSSQSRDAPPSPAGGRSRRKRTLFFALVLTAGTITGAIFLLNGPLFRFALRTALDRAAAAAGLEGSAAVSGTLWSGPRLSAGAFEGAGALRSLGFENLEVSYDLPRMARQGVLAGLTGVRARSLDVTFETPEEKPPPQEGEPSRGGASSSAWEFTPIRDVPVSLENISIRWRAGGQPRCELDGLNFALAPGGSGELSVARLLVPGGRTFENLRASLAIGESSLAIADLSIREDVRIERLLLEKHSLLPAIATGTLELCGGRFALAYTPEAHWHAGLTEGAVDLAALDALVDLDLVEKGSLSGFEARLLDGGALSGEASAAVTGLQAGGHSVDSARIAVRFSGGRLEIDALEATSGANHLEGSGSLALPEGDRKAAAWLEDLSGTLVLEAPESHSVLGAFALPLAGDLTAHVDFAFAGGALTRCEGNVAGDSITWDGMRIESAAAEFSCPRPGVAAADAHINIDSASENTIDAKGEFVLESLRYEGSAAVALRNIEALQPLLAAAGLKTPLAGKAALQWSGSGAIRAKKHGGSLAFEDAAVRVGPGEEIRGQGRLAYDPLGFNASELDLAAGAFGLRGRASLREEILTLAALRLSRGETVLVEGDLSLPLRGGALDSPRAFFSQKGPVAVNVICETLSLDELYATFSPGGVPPVGGHFSGELTASGSLPELNLDSYFKLNGVAHPALEGVAPAEIEVSLTVEGGHLRGAGTVRQELMEPITIAGESAFAPSRWIEDPESWRNEEVALAVDLPETNLAVFLPFLPVVSRLQGTASANLRLDGPAGAPRLQGAANSAIALIKFKRERIPTIGDVDLALVFEGREIRIARGNAEVAGGLVSLGGTISFESGLADPVLALTLRAEQALVARDDYLNLRANADLALNGPFTAATLSGAIAVAESHYVRDVEILPLDVLRRTPALPKGIGADGLRAVEYAPGITQPPFNAWNLDLHITTADPFLVRGNLANASAGADLTVVGTFAAPVVDGKVTLLDGEATLPFSKLKIQRGELVFDEAGGIIPRLNLEGVSSIRQYEIRVRLFDSLLNPKVLLASDPPLPQEDIATLLASGSTREELGNPEAMASKAFQLLAREIGRKVLRRKSTVEQREFLPEDLELSFGQTDLQTGRRTASSHYRISPNLFLLGTLDEGGDSRGLLKILLHFD